VPSTLKRPPTVVDSLPKAELHLHLEGSIRPDTAAELAARHGVRVTAEEVAARYRYANFAEFLETFKWVTSLLREPEDFALVTRQLLEELSTQNVVYAEITISAGVMLLRQQNVEANFQAICEMAESAAGRRVRTAWIFDCVRQFGGDAAMRVAREAARLARAGVVGFGLGGDELSLAASVFRPAFDLACDAGLHVVCHAGEMGGPEAVREAVEVLGAERIGHGIALMHDEALADSLAAQGVALENCPTSNLCTGSLARQTGRAEASLQDHPLARLFARGSLVTLSTDDPGMFHTDLLTEYSHAASLGLSDRQLVKLAEQSFRAAFLSPAEQQRYLEDFRAAARSSGLL